MSCLHWSTGLVRIHLWEYHRRFDDCLSILELQTRWLPLASIVQVRLEGTRFKTVRSQLKISSIGISSILKYFKKSVFALSNSSTNTSALVVQRSSSSLEETLPKYKRVAGPPSCCSLVLSCDKRMPSAAVLTIYCLVYFLPQHPYIFLKHCIHLLA